MIIIIVLIQVMGGAVSDNNDLISVIIDRHIENNELQD